MSGALHVVVDAANVVGSRPDGWWRDREGAARRFTGELVAALGDGRSELRAALGADPDAELQVHLVLEGAAAHVDDLPTSPRLRVVHAERDGDATIARVVAELAGDGAEVLVVTADRGLRERVTAAGARTVGPSALREGLPGDDT